MKTALVTIRLPEDTKTAAREMARAAGVSLSEIVRRCLDGATSPGPIADREPAGAVLPRTNRRKRSAEHRRLDAIMRSLHGTTTRNLAIEDEGEEPVRDIGWATTRLLKAALRHHEPWALLDVSRGSPTAPDFIPARVLGTFATEKEAHSQQRLYPASAVLAIKETGDGRYLQAALSAWEIEKQKRDAELDAAGAAVRAEREKEWTKIVRGERELRLSEFSILVDPPRRLVKKMDRRELHLWDGSQVRFLKEAVSDSKRWLLLALELRRFIDHGVLVAQLSCPREAVDDLDQAWEIARNGDPDLHTVPVEIDMTIEGVHGLREEE